MRKRFIAAGVGASLCLALTLLLIHSYVFPLDSVTPTPTDRVVANDEAHMIWTLWIANDSITSGQNPFQTQKIFWPAGANLSQHTLVVGFFPITFLTKLISGQDPGYPLYSYHLTILLCFSLLPGFSYLLLRRLGFTRLGSAAAAIGFTFSDFFVDHAIHLNIIAAFFLPLIALLLVRVYQSPTFANVVALGVMSAVAIYFTELIAYILIAAICLLIIYLFFQAERKVLADKVRVIGWKPILLVVCLGLLIVAPFLINFARGEAIKPAPGESSIYSANLAGLLIPNSQRTPLYGNLFAKLNARVRIGEPTYETFIGFPSLIFALAGVIVAGKRFVRVSAVLSLVFFILSLGPTLKVLGTDTGVPLPYSLLMRVPPFDLARTPVRFMIIGMFFLMIVAAGGFTLIQNRLRGRPARVFFVVAVLLWTVGEAYVPVLPSYRFTPPNLETIVPGPVLNLPLSQHDGYAAMLQVFHHQPIATGYISRNSAAQIASVEKLEKLVDRGSGQFCDELMKMGYRNIIVNPVTQVEAPFDLSSCSLNVIDLRKPQVDFPRYTLHQRIDLSQPEADPFLTYGWSNREATSRWTDRARAIVAFSIDQLNAKVLRISMGPFLAPGKLDVQRVEIRLNGHDVTTLTLNESTPEEFTFALSAQALKEENVLSFEIPNAESPRNLGISDDQRMLGINVQWIELD